VEEKEFQISGFEISGRTGYLIAEIAWITETGTERFKPLNTLNTRKGMELFTTDCTEGN
jgi:hypothetical protein